MSATENTWRVTIAGQQFDVDARTGMEALGFVTRQRPELYGLAYSLTIRHRIHW
jgi:hypothetical protein